MAPTPPLAARDTPGNPGRPSISRRRRAPTWPPHPHPPLFVGGAPTWPPPPHRPLAPPREPRAAPRSPVGVGPRHGPHTPTGRSGRPGKPGPPLDLPSASGPATWPPHPHWPLGTPRETRAAPRSPVGVGPRHGPHTPTGRSGRPGAPLDLAVRGPMPAAEVPCSISVSADRWPRPLTRLVSGA